MLFRFNRINKPRGFNLKPIYRDELKEKVKSLEDEKIKASIKDNLNIDLSHHKRHGGTKYKTILIFSLILIMILYVMYIL